MTARALVPVPASTFGGVHDFFHSGTWLVIKNLTLFFVAVFWLASAYWVYKDARRRIEDPWLVATATLLGLIPPFIGPMNGTTPSRVATQTSSGSAMRLRPSLYTQ